MPAKTPYEKLHDLSKEIATFGATQSLMEWDQETYMPEGANEFRSQQLSQLSSLIHKLKTSPRFKKALFSLIDLESGRVLNDQLTTREKAALREWRRDTLRSIKLPGSFVKKFTQVTAESTHVWAKARKENNFSLFRPHLEKIVQLSRKKADLLGFEGHPYDALLDLYEPGSTVATLAPLFSRLREGLIDILHKIPKSNAPDFTNISLSNHEQMEFGRFLLNQMGFNPNASRLDLTTHPFCMGLYPRDTRMTTRLSSGPISHIFSVLHEGGHGLYNKNLPLELWGSPLGEQVSLGIDESQSRWWETRIGKSRPFWIFAYPKLQETFPAAFKDVSLDTFYQAINKVEPSLIRVEADEVTYCLHVILRFEIEKELIEGTLKVKDVPDLWREKMKTSLGITPPSDALGCLQDVHWAMGGIGYFPTYALGNIYAAQFFSTFAQKHPDWEKRVSQGDLLFISDWLKENIHRHGREFLPHELIQRVTNAPLTEKFYLDYLKKKFIA